MIIRVTNTTTLLERATRENDDIAQALMFVIHFLGDITQPLHTEAFENGANKIHIMWGHH